jgi:hypothetical protein
MLAYGLPILLTRSLTGQHRAIASLPKLTALRPFVNAHGEQGVFDRDC